jgi:L-arabinose isomerase
MTHLSSSTLAETPLAARLPRPRIGVLPTGHAIYWSQFPGLQERCQALWAQLRARLESLGTVIAPELVDTPEKAAAAGALFGREAIDLLLIFPLGYTTGMTVAPAVRELPCPIRLLNAHADSGYDYATADTAEYLFHEGPCCIPEYAGTLVRLGKPFRVLSGHFGQARLWQELAADIRGAAAARAFRELNFGVLGNTYTGMTDMPTDEHRVLTATGRLLKRPEVEEIEEAYGRVTAAQITDMVGQFRAMYEVDPTVTDEHLRFSAQVAVAYDEVIRRHDISAFGYYWWGEKELVTQLRSQSALAVSRLAALGRPGVTEGDVKTAMAMKIHDLLGAGGMFLEFFAMDYDADVLLVGHDGPSNINVADGKPKLQHLEVHHGKTGHGLGIDFKMQQGPVTLLNLTQFDAGDTFKLIYTVAEVVEGPILNIGNPNCRVKLGQPLHTFMDAWCQQGPSHHLSLGLGDTARELESFAEAMGFRCARV